MLPNAGNGGPARLVSFLRRMGPTAIKIGQYLALRPDLVTQEYCDELLKLVDRVPPFPWPRVRQILAEELGRDPTEVFPYFERRAIAAGSLAQVHRARLDDGTEVAVKILRPEINLQVERDLRRLRLLASVLEKSGATFITSPKDLVHELGDWLHEEIDFTREQANVRRLHKLAEGNPLQRIPRPFAAYSTKRMLTYEYIRGIPVSSLLQEHRSGQQSRWANIDPKQLAETLVTACFTQIFRYQFFHADLHPGNLLVLPGNAIGFVDFGLCDELDDTVRANQLQYISAVYNEDLPRMFSALTQILIPGEESDLEGLRRDFVRETRNLAGKTLSIEADESRLDTSSPMAQYLSGVLRAARQNHFEVPARILSMYRALLTAETLATQLGLRDGLRAVGRQFFEDLQRNEFVSQIFERDTLQNVFASILTLIREGPAQISQILADLSEGNLRLKIEVSESTKMLRLRNRRARLWACAALSVSVAVLLTIPNLPKIGGVPLVWPLSITLLVLYGWCIFLWRRL